MNTCAHACVYVCMCMCLCMHVCATTKGAEWQRQRTDEPDLLEELGGLSSKRHLTVDDQHKYICSSWVQSSNAVCNPKQWQPERQPDMHCHPNPRTDAHAHKAREAKPASEAVWSIQSSNFFVKRRPGESEMTRSLRSTSHSRVGQYRFS